jgi:hypothetical protein
MGGALLCRLRFSKSAPEVRSSGSGIMLLGKNSPATIRNLTLRVVSFLRSGPTTQNESEQLGSRLHTLLSTNKHDVKTQIRVNANMVP